MPQRSPDRTPFHFPARCGHLAKVLPAIFLASLFAGAAPGSASAQNAPVIAGRIEQILQCDDDWSIYITYYPAPGERENVTREAPVVVLLHGDKDNRLVWEGSRGLAPLLQKEKYAVITVDLRKHGQSTNVPGRTGDSPAGGKNTDGANMTAEDYQNMVDRDLEAVKKFILHEHQAKRLNMNRMAIVGAESSAAVALCFTAIDWSKEPYDDAPSFEQKTPRGQDVRALVLISPSQRTKGLPVGEAISQVRNPDWNIAVLTMYGKLNKQDAKDGPAVSSKLAGNSKTNDDRMYRVAFNVKLRGVDLLGKRDVEAEPAIVNFLKLHLANLPGSEWRDRQNRLTKK